MLAMLLCQLAVASGKAQKLMMFVGTHRHHRTPTTDSSRTTRVFWHVHSSLWKVLILMWIVDIVPDCTVVLMTSCCHCHYRCCGAAGRQTAVAEVGLTGREFGFLGGQTALLVLLSAPAVLRLTACFQGNRIGQGRAEAGQRQGRAKTG